MILIEFQTPIFAICSLIMLGSVNLGPLIHGWIRRIQLGSRQLNCRLDLELT